MAFAEFILGSFKQPYFYVGIVACWLLSIWMHTCKEDKQKKQRRMQISRTIIIDDLLEKMRRGEKISIEAIFAQPENIKHPEPPRYRAWKCLVYWMTAKYAEYDYGFETAKDVHKLAEICFGKESLAYSKLIATDEILNRSTKYMLNENKDLHNNKPVEEFTELFDLADMIIDSMYKENY